MVYDVIVVGLGPAGATAAYELSRVGITVLAIEKEKLPRYKPCAGGLSLKVENVLSFPDWRDLIENTVYDLILSYKGEDTQRFHSARPLAYLVSRAQFDFYLAEKAKGAGAEIAQQERVIEIKEDSEAVEITTDKQTYQARYGISADGATSLLARTIYSSKNAHQRKSWVGLTAELQADMNKELESAVYIYFGSILLGYSWIFPKEERYVAGIVGLQKKMKQPRQVFTQFIDQQPMLKNTKLNKVFAHLVPIYQEHNELRYGSRILLAGDAAGLVDPFLGEGIYYALRSGQLAAQTIQKALTAQVQTLEEYEQRITVEIGKELHIAQWISNAVYRVPAVSYHLFKAEPMFFEIYRDVLAGEKRYSDLYAAVKTKVTSLFNAVPSPKS